MVRLLFPTIFDIRVCLSLSFNLPMKVILMLYDVMLLIQNEKYYIYIKSIFDNLLETIML